MQATWTTVDQSPRPATDALEAALAVVQIQGCDNSDCDTPIGSGVIVHPSGLILTAYHVLLTDPTDLNSQRYPDFVIAMTEDMRAAPQPRYRASLVASKDDQDLALLGIDRDLTNAPLERRSLTLPALPLADINNLFGGALPILGYPVSGGEAISIVSANFSSFDDRGRLIIVDRALEPGNSGGPALVEQNGGFAIAGLVIRRRTQDQSSSQGLLRAINQLQNLAWTPHMQAWGENIAVNTHITDGTATLDLTLTLNALDLAGQSLRLLFYATDADQPWRPAGTDAPLVIWADVEPQRVIERRVLTLSVPAESLGEIPDRLRFRALLWKTAEEEESTLWQDENGVQTVAGALALAPAAAATVAPPATPTAEPHPTAIPNPTYDPALAYNITSLVDLAPNEIMRLGRGSIHEVAYAPDGKTLAVATTLGVWLYNFDVPDYGRLLPHTSFVNSVSWSADGTKLASGSSDGTVRLWQAP